MSSHLAATVRIAQNMRIDNETHLSTLVPFEAEMRRRLWWLIVMFDQRICDMIGGTSTILSPTWDCLPPHNLNDGDLHQEAKSLPTAVLDNTSPTEALFCVLRGKLADFTRHTSAHINFVNPAWREVAKATSHGLIDNMDALVEFGKSLEDKYLSSCNPDIPLHFQAMWFTRAALGKLRIMSYFNAISSHGPKAVVSPQVRDLVFRSAVLSIEADTKLLTAPHVQHFRWIADFHFNFVAYVFVVQQLRRQPGHAFADEAWDALDTNISARWLDRGGTGNTMIVKIFGKALLQAWEAREAIAAKQGIALPPPPRIVSETMLFRQASESTRTGSTSAAESPDFGQDIRMDAMFGPGSMFYSDGVNMLGAADAGFDAATFADVDLDVLIDPQMFKTQTW